MILIIGDLYQGKKEYALNKYGQDRIYLEKLDDCLRKELQQTSDSQKAIGNVVKLAENSDIVIACTGYAGLTIIDDEERRFAEIYGNLLTKLAQKAESVERVVCGIGMILK